MKWWDDLWLNEGFASFVEFIGANAAEPSFGMVSWVVLWEGEGGQVERGGWGGVG